MCKKQTQDKGIAIQKLQYHQLWVIGSFKESFGNGSFKYKEITKGWNSMILIKYLTSKLF